ncbi:hypothetical protein ACFD7N_004239 [Vibrio vulnificus]
MKNNILVLVSMFCTAILQLVLMRNMLHIGGKELLGLYTFALGVCGPIFVFFNLGLRNIINSNAAFKYHINDIFTLKLISLLISVVFSYFVIEFYSNSNSNSNSNFDVDIVLYFVFSYKFVESLCEFSTANYIVSRRAFRYCLSSVLKLISVSIFFHINSTKGFNVDEILKYVIFIYLVSSSFDIFELFKYRCRFTINKDLIKKSLFLGIASLIATMTVAYPRVFLGNEGHLDVLADLGMILTIVSIVGMCWSSYLQTNLSKLSRVYSLSVGDGNLHFLKRYIIIVLMLIPIAFLVAVYFGNFILEIIFGIEVDYSKFELYAVVTLTVSTLLQAASNNLLIARGKARTLTCINCLFFFGIVILINCLFSGTFLSMLIVMSTLLFFNALVGIYLGMKKDVLKFSFE